MAYRDSTFFTLKYVAQQLEENEDLLREITIEMFSEDGCLTVYDDYPADETKESITVFTTDGIDYLTEALKDNRDHYVEQRKKTELFYAKKSL